MRTIISVLCPLVTMAVTGVVAPASAAEAVDLAETGATTTWLLPVGGGIVLLGIILLVLIRIRRAKSER